MTDETKMADETKVILLQKCLEICQLFGEKCFNISVSMKGFNFTVNHGLVEKSNKTKKKYMSPSTRRRNNMRLQAFKAKKATKEGNNPTTGAPPHPNLDTPVGEDDLSDSDTDTRDDPTNLETRRVDVPLVVAVDVHPPPIPPPKKTPETPRTPPTQLQCDICGQTFGKRVGLNGHIRKKHQQIEQLDGAQNDTNETLLSEDNNMQALVTLVREAWNESRNEIWNEVWK